MASVVIIWRFWGATVQFLVLAPYVAVEAVRTLAAGRDVDTTWVGIGLTIASALSMPLFAVAKRRVGARLGSAATMAEGTQNLLCAYLSVAVLAGLLGNAAAGWWWLDPLAALAIAYVAVQEGREAWRGEECGCG